MKVYLADEVAARVGNVDLTQVVHGHVFGLVEVGAYCQAEVTTGPRNAIAGDGGYYYRQIGIDLSDPVIERVSDVDVCRRRSTSTPCGEWKAASSAEPSSPSKPGLPEPATVVMIPVARSIFRMRLLAESAM